MIHEVLEAWGNEGLQTHVRKMQTEYKKRAAIVQEAAGKLYSSVAWMMEGEIVCS
jgi:DNA-binding transcriptional MocR family regulator